MVKLWLYLVDWYEYINNVLGLKEYFIMIFLFLIKIGSKYMYY